MNKKKNRKGAIELGTIPVSALVLFVAVVTALLFMMYGSGRSAGSAVGMFNIVEGNTYADNTMQMLLRTEVYTCMKADNPNEYCPAVYWKTHAWYDDEQCSEATCDSDDCEVGKGDTCDGWECGCARANTIRDIIKRGEDAVETNTPLISNILNKYVREEGGTYRLEIKMVGFTKTIGTADPLKSYITEVELYTYTGDRATLKIMIEK